MGERERKVKNNKLQFTHKEKHTNQKILECRKKKIPKILCGCTNPITSNNMAPTDHCRTQPVEHRLGRNDSKITTGEKNRKKENMKKPEVYREPMHMKIIQIHTPYHDWRDWLHKARRRRDPYFKEISYCEINSEGMKFYRKRSEKNEKLHKEIPLSSLVSINIRKNGVHSTCLIEMFSSTGQIINLKL